MTRLRTPASASDLSLGAQEDAERGRFAVGMRAKVGVAARLVPQPCSMNVSNVPMQEAALVESEAPDLEEGEWTLIEEVRH